MLKEFKIILVGDAAVGKSVYMKLLTEKYFEKKYIATIDANIYSLKVRDAIFNIWDCSGSRIMGGLNSKHYKNADAIIFMFTKFTIKSKLSWLNQDIPIITVKNKVDNGEFSITDYIKISCRNNYNINAPINKLYEILAQ